MKKVTQLFLTFMLCSLTTTYAQQEPQYTQYMYNMSIINPAYMTNDLSLIQVGSLYRTQWVGIKAAPKTANVFAQIPLTERIEVSLNYLNDNIGEKVSLNENVYNINAAYKIMLKNNLNVSFGLKLGTTHLSANYWQSNIAVPEYNGPSKTNVNIGAGVFVFKKQFYVGLSTPNLIPSKLENNDIAYQSKAHTFLMGGYVFDINDDIKLKPSTVIKHTNGAPLSFDVSVNTLLYKRFEAGVAYRYQDAVSALIGFKVTPSLRLGYAYDFTTNDLKEYSSGSHEFILLYTFDVLGLNKKYESPRFY